MVGLSEIVLHANIPFIGKAEERKRTNVQIVIFPTEDPDGRRYADFSSQHIYFT